MNNSFGVMQGLRQRPSLRNIILIQALIAGGHFYIAGFGKVGKMVANVMSSLGADVTIIARSDRQLGEALAHRYGASNSLQIL